jgi:2-methylaconitate cis-trans-isomerase PrpF
MRGGTSKGVFLRDADLPADEDERRRTILSIFGSPDRRQIDGLGGADPLTSKVAIIGPASNGGQLTYTFGQVEIDRPSIDYASPCGNIISAVGAYAVYERLVAPVAPVTRVRVYNTNLERIITLEVPVENGVPVERGDYVIPGVPGSGARILVDLSQTAGGACGALLPTGNVTDVFDLGGGDKIEVSLVDIANPHVFIRAKDIGLTGTETLAQIDGNKDLLARLEVIRGLAAVKFGLVEDPLRAKDDSRITPMLAFVAPPANYSDPARGVDVKASDIDLTSRLIFLERAHSTYAATSIACTGVAALLPGSIVNEVTQPAAQERGVIRIGHVAGIFETESRVEFGDGAPVVRRATLGRTARRLLEGQVFID